MTKTITLAQGNGGEENNELISKIFYKAFHNEILEKSEDAAVIHGGELAFLPTALPSRLSSLPEQTSASLPFAEPVTTLP